MFLLILIGTLVTFDVLLGLLWGDPQNNPWENEEAGGRDENGNKQYHTILKLLFQ